MKLADFAVLWSEAGHLHVVDRLAEAKADLEAKGGAYRREPPEARKVGRSIVFGPKRVGSDVWSGVDHGRRHMPLTSINKCSLSKDPNDIQRSKRIKRLTFLAMLLSSICSVCHLHVPHFGSEGVGGMEVA